MKAKYSRTLIIIFILQLLFMVGFFIFKGQAAVEDFEPEYGLAPEIDGEIENSKKEWENASKEEITLFSSSPTDSGLDIKLWVMQNDSDLYISVQYKLEQYYEEEFIAILISTGESESNESFYDAKMVKFSNLGASNEASNYYDYHIQNGVFLKDKDEEGDGAAKSDEKKRIFEFKIPVNNSDAEDSDDVRLDFGDTFAFKIVFGYGSNFPYSMLSNNIVLIEIQYPPKKEANIWIFVHNILSIIIYSGFGIIFLLYIYKISIIKKKIKLDK